MHGAIGCRHRREKQLMSHAQLQTALRGEADGSYSRLVVRRLDELKAHPSYLRHRLTVSAAQLSALAECGEMAFQDPLVITLDGAILDGYARWELARHQERSALLCIEYELSEEEGLCWLLQRHRTVRGLNGFCRTLLALELEPRLQERARSNQRAGGQQRGLSKLTEADRLNVRAEIAAAAGVSAGNVSKVRQLVATAHPAIREALRQGEVSIHKAWLWSNRSSAEQRELLERYQSERGIKKTIRKLISRHRQKGTASLRHFVDLFERLAALESSNSSSVGVAVVRAPGKTVFVTEELLQALGAQQATLCVASNH
jgi:hypothetical protein